jgi:vacuolar-type H+-ATPase subunit E/Vma4
MNLDKLVQEIRGEGQKEINSLRKESELMLAEIDKEKQEQLNLLSQEKEKELIKEKEKALSDYQKEKEFQFNMELLRLKKKLIKEAVSFSQKEAKKLSISEKKEILQKKLKEIKNHLNGDYSVSVSQGSQLNDIFNNVSVKEKELGFNDGFIVENNKFFFNVSLDNLIDEISEKENDFFAQILFKKE